MLIVINFGIFFNNFKIINIYINVILIIFNSFWININIYMVLYFQYVEILMKQFNIRYCKVEIIILVKSEVS